MTLHSSLTRVMGGLLVMVLSFSSLCAVNENNNKAKMERIVSVGGSVTEILFALGAGNKVIAADTSSLYPQAADQLPKIGYYRQMSVEGVLSMQPDHVFAAQGAGPTNVLNQLEQANISVSVFKQPRTVEGLNTLIMQIGSTANLVNNAQILADNIMSELEHVKDISKNSGAKAVFLMSASDRGLMVAGSDTVPNLIMNIAGLNNPYSHVKGFKPVSTESFLMINPSHVFIAAHRTNGMTTQALCKTPALLQWSLSNGCYVTAVDPLLFLGMTPRLPEAVRTFADVVEAEKKSTHIEKVIGD